MQDLYNWSFRCVISTVVSPLVVQPCCCPIDLWKLLKIDICRCPHLIIDMKLREPVYMIIYHVCCCIFSTLSFYEVTKHCILDVCDVDACILANTSCWFNTHTWTTWMFYDFLINLRLLASLLSGPGPGRGALVTSRCCAVQCHTVSYNLYAAKQVLHPCKTNDIARIQSTTANNMQQAESYATRGIYTMHHPNAVVEPGTKLWRVHDTLWGLSTMTCLFLEPFGLEASSTLNPKDIFSYAHLLDRMETVLLLAVPPARSI